MSIIKSTSDRFLEKLLNEFPEFRRALKLTDQQKFAEYMFHQGFSAGCEFYEGYILDDDIKITQLEGEMEE